MINIRTQISTNEMKERNKHKPEKALKICGKKNNQDMCVAIISPLQSLLSTKT